MMRVGVVFEKEFSELPALRQKQVLGEYLIHAACQCAKRLSKRADYDFELMVSDFSSIVQEWEGA